MTRLRRPAASVFAALALAACSPYSAPHLSANPADYAAVAKLDPAAIRERIPDVDARRFRLVVLYSITNFYPARYEFAARAALADAGVTHVVNSGELAALVRSHPRLREMDSADHSV